MQVVTGVQTVPVLEARGLQLEPSVKVEMLYMLAEAAEVEYRTEIRVPEEPEAEELEEGLQEPEIQVLLTLAAVEAVAEELFMEPPLPEESAGLALFLYD